MAYCKKLISFPLLCTLAKNTCFYINCNCNKKKLGIREHNFTFLRTFVVYAFGFALHEFSSFYSCKYFNTNSRKQPKWNYGKSPLLSFRCGLQPSFDSSWQASSLHIKQWLRNGCCAWHVPIQTASGPLLVISIGLRHLFQWSGRFKLFKSWVRVTIYFPRVRYWAFCGHTALSNWCCMTTIPTESTSVTFLSQEIIMNI